MNELQETIPKEQTPSISGGNPVHGGDAQDDIRHEDRPSGNGNVTKKRRLIERRVSSGGLVNRLQLGQEGRAPVEVGPATPGAVANALAFVERRRQRFSSTGSRDSEPQSDDSGNERVYDTPRTRAVVQW
eukprot:CAMPEP_0203773448 /NCGR_PEP_ID=MMETSP0099_2-20121227/4664_1 /ASSEMBLY_ACC=CAM_ASM_000209 /TAXON_ID=96639 /ORGANISM=" , Strain NY0313808BC1" /LENGTH=129 /DNA_ID=CAMNT_0050671281 /DNA_START=313 /DNA_END=699 /DNA_ORIENTATION=-